MLSSSKVVASIALSVVALGAIAQTNNATSPAQPSHIVFDVVSVKSNHTDISHPGSMIRSDGFDAENITPIWVMYWAFGFDMDRDEHRFSGLPVWVKSERVDIIAKVADVDVTTWKKFSDQEKERMVLGVLKDRFKLLFHLEPHEQPVYALVVAKGGPKMIPAEVTESDHVYGKNGFVGLVRGGVGGLHATMKTLVDYLNGQQLGRRVVDRTGLTGNYDFKLNYTPFPTGSSPDDIAVPSGPIYPYIFTAVQEQLGLKLEPTRGSVDTIVIDHIERPSQN